MWHNKGKYTRFYPVEKIAFRFQNSGLNNDNMKVASFLFHVRQCSFSILNESLKELNSLLMPPEAIFV